MNLFDVLISLIMTILLVSVLANVVQWGNDKNRQKIAAEQLEEVAKAAQLYAKKNQLAILPAITPTSGTTVSIAQLVTDGFLPQGFSPTNIWNQGYAIYFRRMDTTVPDIAAGSGTKIEKGINTVVLTTGGTDNSKKFCNGIVPGVLGFMALGGGYIPSGDISTQPTSDLVGAGWSRNLASMGIPNPGAGHIGFISSYDTSELGQDVLYRVAIPGMPELNAMQTELDMTDHAVKRMKEIQLVPHTMAEMTNFCASATAEQQGRLFLSNADGVYICRNNQVEILADSGNSNFVKSATVAVNGERIVKPTCAPNTNTIPQIFVAPAIAAPGPTAPPMTALQAWATEYSPTEWQVHIRLQTTNKTLSTYGDNSGWVWPTDNYARILVLSMCGKN